jgi:hypothetical protein
LSRLNIKYEVAINLSTEISTITSNFPRFDKLYQTGPFAITNIEFDSSGELENLDRYMFYSAFNSSWLYERYNKYPRLSTIVIYPNNITKFPPSV